ncbi:MAG: hypothetical protein ACYC4L_15280 [Chloroflexota bacterium]
MRRRKPTRAEALGLQNEPLSAADRAHLTAAAGEGLAAETQILRLLIRRALDEGRPAGQVADLIDCLARVLRTQHALSGTNAKQLDEALANALDKIAAEIGVAL